MSQQVFDYTLPEGLCGTFLEEITRARIPEIAGASRKWPAEAIRPALDRAPTTRSLRRSLMRKSPAVIAELKKASPSAGLLRPDFDPLKLGRELEDAGAAALSVVTEPRYFQGTLEHIAVLRWSVGVPILRKDFIVDSYQVLEARHAGADSVLLIAALLDDRLLRRLREETEALGMEALVEVHSADELGRALRSGATIVGVNNRDLRTLQISLDVSFELAKQFPREILAISESGIRTADDIRRLSDAGYRGFLVGEQLMRSASPGAALASVVQKVASPQRSAS
jgi:indole-3-glycerol phosphate synthase